ncbi:type I secretion system permease/ATPase [Sansalvadorimonas sp. 2012CJ34-2]|uniref:Type I secretion system permease/ATPase n=1 Tax=Parendozoicomonas callyspongiae TaxID=2942213 RepID=A0ABT0PAN4_9GAMM|nr:type I secretion system permease/ATPase [Sansalvadorimonas sp. 2012CJ34-2]MCL6268390.1 type I secretion system permease/ATPase [Sansalvadorimonas sp. 2012CJ34-2]
MSEAAKPQKDWSIPRDGSTHLDPLLDCLVTITRIHGRSSSADALKHGLPLQDNRLTAELFIRAAARGGFAARLVKTPLKKISSLVTPVVLLLKGRKACIMTNIDFKRGNAKVIFPEAGSGTQDVSLQQLVKEYSGHAFFIREKYQYDDRAPETLKIRSRHWFWGTITQSWRIYRDVLLASFLINTFAIASPLFVMNVYDRVVPNNAIDTLWVLAFGAMILFTFDTVLKLMRSYFIDLAGRKSDILLSARIFEKVLGLSMASRPQSVGSFARNVQEFESIRDFITSSTVTALVDLPFTLIILMVVGFIGGPLAVVPAIGALIIALYGFALQSPLRKSVDKTVRSSAQKNATLIEVLGSAESIKVARAESEMQAKWEKNVGHIAKWGVRSKMLSASAGTIAAFIQQVVTVALVVGGVYMIAEGELSMGGLIATVMLSGRCLAPMGQVAGLSTRYNQTKVALNALNDIMKMPSDRPEGKSYAHRPVLKGDIEFEQVNFSYPGQEFKALNNVSLRIKAGEKVGIIGRIGSGKTTVEKMILGLYQPENGAVRIDGVDLRQVNPSDLRHNIGCALQDTCLMYGTLKENISLGASYMDDSAILKAAEISGVKEFADRHPEGLDMQVGERGGNLSGGQRQSVAMARAMLMDAPIVVLDEPCSSMDNTTETRLRQNLQGYCQNKTLILVTHKASMLDLVDRLIVMDQGRIVADGPKDQVFAALREGKLRIS